MRKPNPVVSIEFPSLPPIGTVVQRKSGARWRLVEASCDELVWKREDDGYEHRSTLKADLTRNMFGVGKKRAIKND